MGGAKNEEGISNVMCCDVARGTYTSVGTTSSTTRPLGMKIVGAGVAPNRGCWGGTKLNVLPPQYPRFHT